MEPLLGKEDSQKVAMLLDTNIVIEHLDAVPSVVAALAEHKQNGETFVISVVTVTEVLSHDKLRADDITKIKRYLDTLLVLPIDITIAEMAAEVRRTYRLITPDALIVATALVSGMRLATRDKQMQKVKEVDFVKI